MAIDNQLLLGTALFAGIAYIIYQGTLVDKEGNTVAAISKEGEELLQEFSKLKDRLHQFEVFDARKGRFHKRAPLETDTRDGLVEVLTRLRGLEKKQQKGQFLNQRQAVPFHNQISDLDTKCRTYLNRYPTAQQEKAPDARNVAHVRFDAEAVQRGKRAHSREASFVADQIAAIEGEAFSPPTSPKKKKTKEEKEAKTQF